jgi:hypothetical protein
MVINVCSTMAVVTKYVTTVAEEKFNVRAGSDINWRMIKRLVSVRNIKTCLLSLVNEVSSVFSCWLLSLVTQV